MFSKGPIDSQNLESFQSLPYCPMLGQLHYPLAFYFRLSIFTRTHLFFWLMRFFLQFIFRLIPTYRRSGSSFKANFDRFFIDLGIIYVGY